MYTVTLMNAVASGADLTTTSTITEYPDGINLVKRPCEKGNLAIEVKSTGNGTTATIKLQHSDNGTTFTDVDQGSIALSSANTFTLLMTNAMKQYYRYVYSKGDNTTGTITATLTFS